MGGSERAMTAKGVRIGATKLCKTSKKSQEQSTKALKLYEKKFRKIESHKSKFEGLRTEISGLKLRLSDLMEKLSLQSINSFLSSTAIEDDLLNLCQEAHRLGF
ncbi:hypothetical protein ACH5RR_012490 [Cinchona calisaya]|uniref:Uncharacterized protein n=1 Tax=Cinchona calisaya TaxID=153742 RepID=A0ABD3A7W1_9GENT